MFITLKSAPNDKLLLSLCLHYDIYDKVSQQKIDELCQLSLTTDKGVNVFSETIDDKVDLKNNEQSSPGRKEIIKENIAE
jgi:hypothetical protein